MSQGMECIERHRLTRLYAVATSDYGRALDVLQTHTGVMDTSTYGQVNESTEKARLSAEKARADLDLHTAEHGC